MLLPCLILGLMVSILNADFLPILTTIKSFKKVVILRIGNSLNIELERIYKEVTRPHMTIDLEQHSYYFSLYNSTSLDGTPPIAPQYSVITRNGRNSSFPHLKFFLDNHEFLVVILFGNSNNLDLEVVESLLEFRKATSILLVTSQANSTSLLEKMSRRGLSNVIISNPDDPYAWTTFESFPKFTISYRSGFPVFKTSVRDIHGKTLKVGAFVRGIRCFKFWRNGRFVYGGWQTSIVKNFIRKVNGTIDYEFLTSETVASAKLNSGKLDFITAIYNLTVLNSEYASDHMFLLFGGLILPAPKEIHRSLYIWKPMDVTVWLVFSSAIVYVAFIVSVSFKRPQLRDKFWKFFSFSLRVLLGQPCEYPTRHLRTVYVILLVCGFIGYSWYSIFLGTFLTTTLYESPMQTLEDFIDSPYKVFIFDHLYDIITTRNISPIPRDKAVPVTADDLDTLLVLRLNASNGWHMGTDFWEYYLKPLQERYNLKRFIWNQYIVSLNHFFLSVNGNFFLKNELNRFLHLAMDSGLFIRYFRNAFIERRKVMLSTMLLNSMQFIQDKDIQKLSLGYFQYAFALLAVGWILALGSFVIEMTLLRCYHGWRFHTFGRNTHFKEDWILNF